MNILVVNGSPKGKNSTTLCISLYLEKLFGEHSFCVLDAARKIKALEKDFSSAEEALKKAELIIFSYPVYTFLVPSQLHRFIELIKENNIDLKGKYATQISTSKHFYDVTAHAFIEENCYDLGLKYLRGFSADMEDLTSKKGRKQARDFFSQTMFFIENGMKSAPERREAKKPLPYESGLKETAHDRLKTVAVVTALRDKDTNLKNMIADFSASTSCRTKLIDLNEFKFTGGCLGCMQCAIEGKCVYKDGFKEYLNGIHSCDAFVYAFTIENHYAPSVFKMFDDRQFCNGHRTVTEGKPVGYIVSGDLSAEKNLSVMIEARSEVGGNFLCSVASDTDPDPKDSIRNLALIMDEALENGWSRPKNFYGTGGTKIFRDLIYMMQGFMREDHKFYKKHGIYDFPQKQKKNIILMKLAGAALRNPSIKKKMGAKLDEFMVMPYKKVVENALIDKE